MSIETRQDGATEFDLAESGVEMCGHGAGDLSYMY